MTVTDVLLNFRAALLGVLPSVQWAEVPWQRPGSYDEWDSIASALFNTLVTDVLRWSLPPAIQQGFRMPRYDLLQESYAGVCVIEAKHPSLLTEGYIFHGFGTDVTPFDVVEIRLVPNGNDPIGDDLTLCPVGGMGFRLQFDSSLSNDPPIEVVQLSG